MRRDEIIARLRQLEKMRLQVEAMDRALDQLTREELAVMDKMFLHPVENASDKLCQMFDIEVSAVYKRRNKILKKLADFLDKVV